MVHVIQIRDKFSGLWETTEQFDLRLLLPRTTTFLAGARATPRRSFERRSAWNAEIDRVQVTSQLTKRLLLTLTGYLRARRSAMSMILTRAGGATRRPR